MRFDNSRRPREITDAKIRFISLVARGANDRDFLLAKSDSGEPELVTNGPILKADDSARGGRNKS